MKKGYFFILIATIAFSSMEVVLKLIAGEVNPVQLTLARFSIGFVFLAPVAVYTLKKRSKRLDRKSVAYFALLGLIGIAICMPIYQMSINFTESSVVAVLFSCNPVFVTFFAFMILKEPIKRRHLAALSLEILGTLAIINPLHIKLNMVGVGLALCSTVLFSIYGVMGKRKCAEYGGAVVTCFSFLFGSVIIFCFILITHIPAVAGFFQSIGLPSFAQIPILEGYTLQNLPYVLYVSAGVAGVGFCAYFLAMEYQPGQRGLAGVFLQAGALAHTGLDGPRGGDPGQYAGGYPADPGGLVCQYHPRDTGDQTRQTTDAVQLSFDRCNRCM